MNIKKLQNQLEYDEGYKLEIYEDHLGLPTFGIGHLIRESDQEYGSKVGTSVSKKRVNEVFKKDVKSVLSDCNKVFGDFDKLPEEAQQVIANMMFNLGINRFKKFKNFIKGVNDRELVEAGNQMIDSRWYVQVTKRAQRLVKRIKALALENYEI